MKMREGQNLGAFSQVWLVLFSNHIEMLLLKVFTSLSLISERLRIGEEVLGFGRACYMGGICYRAHRDVLLVLVLASTYLKTTCCAFRRKAIMKLETIVTLLNELVSGDHSWNITALRDILQPEPAISTLQTPISWTNPQDTLFWPFSLNGSYTMKSGRKRILDLNPQTHTKTSSSSAPL